MSKSNPLTRAKKKQARELFLAHRLPEARELYTRICQLDRRDIEAWALLGAIQEQLGEYRDAETCLRQAIALQPNIPDGFLTLGNVLLKQGKAEEAEACYRQELKQRPTHVLAYNNLASALIAQGKLDEAIVNLQRAVDIKPDYADAYSNLGNARAKQGKFDEAVADYHKAIQSNPGFVEAYNNLGLTLMRQGKQEEAKACYQQLLRLKPGHVEARYSLAMLGAEPQPGNAPTEYVKSLFDGFADSFDKHLIEELAYQTPELLNQAVRRVIGQPSARYDVIDLGCGTGLCGPLFRDLARTLTGIDLSPKMIDKAKERQVYDLLQVTDLITPLRAPNAAYDLILAADVFVYIGDFAPVFDAVKSALRPDGLFAFSVEAANAPESATYALRVTGRYAHASEYIRGLARAAGMEEISQDTVELRREAGKPVNGYIFVLRKSA